MWHLETEGIKLNLAVFLQYYCRSLEEKNQFCEPSLGHNLFILHGLFFNEYGAGSNYSILSFSSLLPASKFQSKHYEHCAAVNSIV